MTSTPVRVLTSEHAIRRYQLRVVISAIQLEQRGLRFGRGSVKAKWAKHFGLSPRAKAADVIALLQRTINELYNQEAGNGST